MTVASATAADTQLTPVPPALRGETLSLALLAAATNDQVATEGFVHSTGEAPVSGSSVTAWVGVVLDGKKQQWLVRMRRAAPTEKEQKKTPGWPRAYASWGAQFDFSPEVAAIEYWIAGPVTINASASDLTAPVAPAKTQRGRLTVRADYLTLGLDACARSPLDASSGILALVAVHPRKPENRLEIRLVASRAGE